VEQLGSYWTDFNEIWHFEYFLKNMSRKLRFHSNLARTTVTLHEDQYNFLILSRSIILRTKNISNKNYRGNQNTNYVQNFF